jgi:hypothetical protein
MSKPYPPRPLSTIRQPTFYPQPRGLLWQMSENGTLPEADRALHDDNKLLPVLDPQACEVCRRITISALTMKTAPYGFKHHTSERALLSSANLGCRMCLWVCFALFFEPSLEGQVEKGGTRAPKPDETSSRYRYPPILHYSESLRGITILNPYETTNRNILRVYTNHCPSSSKTLVQQLI